MNKLAIDLTPRECIMQLAGGYPGPLSVLARLQGDGMGGTEGHVDLYRLDEAGIYGLEALAATTGDPQEIDANDIAAACTIVLQRLARLEERLEGKQLPFRPKLSPGMRSYQRLVVRRRDGTS